MHSSMGKAAESRAEHLTPSWRGDMELLEIWVPDLIIILSQTATLHQSLRHDIEPKSSKYACSLVTSPSICTDLASIHCRDMSHQRLAWLRRSSNITPRCDKEVSMLRRIDFSPTQICDIPTSPAPQAEARPLSNPRAQNVERRAHTPQDHAPRDRPCGNP